MDERSSGMTAGQRRLKAWLIDLVAGGVVGLALAAIAAVNFVIFIGVERGYESSMGEVFEHSLAAGVITVLILIGGPVAGVFVARRRRDRQSSHP